MMVLRAFYIQVEYRRVRHIDAGDWNFLMRDMLMAQTKQAPQMRYRLYVVPHGYDKFVFSSQEVKHG